MRVLSDASRLQQELDQPVYFRSVGQLLGYDAFHLVEELLTEPVQIVVGGRFGTTFSYEDGKMLFERARNAEDFFVVGGIWAEPAKLSKRY